VPASTVDLLPTITSLASLSEPWPQGVEGGNLAAVLAGAPDATVQRSRDEFVVHFPHYDRDGQGPSSTMILGSDKLIHLYETGHPLLFDLSKDIREKHDLSADNPGKAAELDQRLMRYLESVKAQMPSPNPGYHPTGPK
jgi:arylsulfatase A